MPILALLADFADAPLLDRRHRVPARSGLVNYITPTAAVVMGGLTLAKVRYDHYLRFALPFVRLIFVLTCLLLALGTASAS